ncbi:MAG TPA: bifunctional DNA-formamidopyrimidine glycosylase/DNA-(apurinic or apyrimidinic site) lyase [Candidatus Saccharimonadia bacterium]|nr:bifunctional DNA-formamidopyrimidine glycosylase/DNA-(apurinic or apyrimidinic site) lyase [Candidatus Saccharimonadia bacterium]
MPELPEVETTRRGIAPHLVGQRIERLVARIPALRWPIPPSLARALRGREVHEVERRAKYLLLHVDPGAVLLHLGMSGSLQVLPRGTPLRAHDHVDFELVNGQLLRFNDPRRFGCVLWQRRGTTHELLSNLGPEPLGASFDGEHLFRASRGRSAPVKHFLMDQRIVVGVGNIYAAEALFAAGIHPKRAAGRITLARYERLATEIRRVLEYAISRGGTTLRDFLAPDGAPGYFEQELFVYDRAGEPCRVCGTALRLADWGQRQTAYCPRCQR